MDKIIFESKESVVSSITEVNDRHAGNHIEIRLNNGRMLVLNEGDEEGEVQCGIYRSFSWDEGGDGMIGMISVHPSKSRAAIFPEHTDAEIRQSPRFVYSFNACDGSDGKSPVRIEDYLYSRSKIGDIICASAAAPSTGRIVEEVVGKDEHGLLVRTLENSVREMTEEEVR